MKINFRVDINKLTSVTIFVISFLINFINMIASEENKNVLPISSPMSSPNTSLPNINSININSSVNSPIYNPSIPGKSKNISDRYEKPVHREALEANTRGSYKAL